MKKLLHLIVLGLMITTACNAQPILQTKVEGGKVEGVLEGNDLAVYKAIPYCEPPLGDLRWKPLQPVKPWKGVLKAEDVAKWPPQPEKSYVNYDMMDEDCLYLSVATPAKSVNDGLPVMVYIHGGSFATEHYGGALWQSLARRGVITVSIEFRNGALGFLVNDELAKESPNGHSGNYGILDQIYALKWIQRNIKNFGGDPSKVTIFGESAGAMSCHILCASPLAKGLFRACISQSGSYIAGDGMGTYSEKDLLEETQGFMQRANVNSIAEMRKMDAKDLTGNNTFYPSMPVIDGYVIPDKLYNLYQKGEYNDVPVLIMHNSDEGAAGVAAISAEEYDAVLKSLEFPENWVDSVKQYYPANTDEECLFSVRDLTRDYQFGWPAYMWATLQKKTGKSPVYVAYLAQKSEKTVYAQGNRRGAAHADDCMYLSGAFEEEADKYPVEKQLSDIMQEYWVNFAKTGGNPNGSGLPQWIEYEPGTKSVMQFNNGATLINLPNKDKIDFMDRFMKAIYKL